MTANYRAGASSAFASAVMHHKLGQLHNAERFYRSQLQSDGRHVGALRGLGALLSQQRKFDKSRVFFQRALDLEPDSAETHNNLAVVLVGLDRIEEAAAHFKKAVALDPQNAAAHNGLGTTHAQAKRYEEALEEYRKATALKPDFPDAFRNLGLALCMLGRYDESCAAYRQAVALAPNDPQIHFSLGVLHAEWGDLAAAEAEIGAALALAPLRPDFHRHLALIKRYEPGDPHLARMKELVDQPRLLKPPAQMELHFAIAKALLDIGDDEQAFAHLQKGNAQKRRQTAYNEAATLRLLDRICRAFGGELMAREREKADASPTPVFIVGMPRSGTTLVEQILASHPAVFGAGELPDLEEVVTALGSFPEGVADMSDEALRAFGATYLARIRTLAPAAPCIADKMPGNFRYIGLIRLALPQARIIHVRRDPVDTCMSCFAQFFNQVPYAYDLGEIGRYYRGYAALMRHWRQTVPPNMMLEVQYERLVDDLPGETRRMLAHCSLDWSPACLDFHATRRVVQTASIAQVREPIYRRSIGRWQEHRALLKPLLDALGPSAATPPQNP
jgi:Flp pilus assembly protein TadD